MGFIVRTIFWLGLVYSAMPLDFGSPVSGRVAAVTDDNPLAPCVRGAAEDCQRRLGALSKALDAADGFGLIDRVIQMTEEAALKDLGQIPKVPDPATKGWAAPPHRPIQ